MRFLTLLICLGLSTGCLAQYLSGLDTAAFYSLIGTAHDATGHYPDMELQNAPFAGMNGVFSNGIYINDTLPGGCLISTPAISALYDSVFAVQVEFRIAAFVSTQAVIVCGNDYRYLGLLHDNSGDVYVLFNNNWPWLQGVQLEVTRWYTLTLLHNQAAETSEYWLDDQLIATRNGPLDRSDTDDRVTNTSFGSGLTFAGHLRNLRILSARSVVSKSRDILRKGTPRLSQNPVFDEVRIIDVPENSTWTLHDYSGQVVKTGRLLNDTRIDLSDVDAGMYIVVVQTTDQRHVFKLIRSDN